MSFPKFYLDITLQLIHTYIYYKRYNTNIAAIKFQSYPYDVF